MKPEFKTLGAQIIEDDPFNDFWADPMASMGMPTYRPPSVDRELKKRLLNLSSMTGLSYEDNIDRAIREVNKETTEGFKSSMIEMADQFPVISSLYSVAMSPMEWVGRLQRVTDKITGIETDPNTSAFFVTNMNEGIRETVEANLADKHGAFAAGAYSTIMPFLDSLFSLGVFGGGVIGEAADVGASAMDRYSSLVAGGMPHKDALALAAAEAGLEFVDLPGKMGDAIQTAMKKSGLWDDFLRLAKKSPAAKELIDQADDRIQGELFLTGLDDPDLTPLQKSRLISQIDQRNGLSDEEIDKVVKEILESDEEIPILTTKEGNGISEKRNWRESEIAAQQFFPEYQEQVSFWNGESTYYGKKGSVRPDFYKEENSVEIKNYNLSSPSNVNKMIKTIEQQYIQRVGHLPPGTKQMVVIDILGQNVSKAQCINIMERIYACTNHQMDVWFMQ